MIPETLKNAIFSLILTDPKTPHDKVVNDFLLDLHNTSKKFYETSHEIKDLK